jgi:hypothetical protein
MSSVVIAGNTSGTITLDAPNVAGTTVLTLPTANGTVLTTNTSGIASVNGIQFPATQSASADANCLDDYEEGTFTPTFIGATVTYGQQVGYYTKIGNLVYFYLHISSTALTRTATAINIGGLPFAAGSDPGGEYYTPMSIFIQQGFNQTVAIQGYSPLIGQSQTSIAVYGQANGTGVNYAATTYNDLQTGVNFIRLSGFYKVT